MSGDRVQRAPSANERRARRLLAGGAVGGHLGAVVVTGLFWAFGGRASGLSAAVAAVVTLAFYTIGLAVQVIVADAPPKKVLFAAMASYGLRVTVLGLVLAVVLVNGQTILGFDPVAVVVATITVVVCWLASEFWVYSRLRIPAFDPPEE